MRIPRKKDLMKDLITMYRAEPLHNRVLYPLYAFILIFVFFFVIPMKEARAQAGNVYAKPQAQQAGDALEGVVLQVSIKEVEPSNQARFAGAAVGSALGVAIATRSNSQNRSAVNTVGAVLGGLLGERTTHAIVRTDAQEIIVLLAPVRGQQPRILAIVQPAPFDAVYPGEAIYVVNIRGAFRVLRRMPVAHSAPTL